MIINSIQFIGKQKSIFWKKNLLDSVLSVKFKEKNKKIIQVPVLLLRNSTN